MPFVRNQIGGVAEQILKRIRDLLFVLPVSKPVSIVNNGGDCFISEHFN